LLGGVNRRLRPRGADGARLGCSPLVRELFLALQFFVEAHVWLLMIESCPQTPCSKYVNPLAVVGAHLLVDVNCPHGAWHLVVQLARAPVLVFSILPPFSGRPCFDGGEDLLGFRLRLAGRAMKIRS